MDVHGALKQKEMKACNCSKLSNKFGLFQIQREPVNLLLNNVFFSKNRPFPASFYFRIFNTVDSKQMFNIIFLPMAGFEPRTSCIESNHSTN